MGSKIEPSGVAARLSVPEADLVSGAIVLPPAASKRLIARAVATMPQVRRAKEVGRIMVSLGTTTAYVAEELLGNEIAGKFHYAAGAIYDTKLGASPAGKRMTPFLLHQGLPVQGMQPRDFLKDFDADDVFIKSANAVDHKGHAGILMSDTQGGTIGMAIGIVVARGAHMIVPVGLEKLIPSVIEASKKCGILKLKRAHGDTMGLMPLVNATVVTEIQALEILTGVSATHVASGGIGGSEGCVTLVVEGTEEQVDAAFELTDQVKAEPPILAGDD